MSRRNEVRVVLGIVLVFAGLSGEAFEVTTAETRGKREVTTRSSELTVTGGLAVGGGVTMPGIQGAISTALFNDLPLFVGLDAGLFTQTKPFALVFTVFPNAYWKFGAKKGVEPRVGLGLGPVFSTGGGRSVVTFGGYFAAGVDVSLEENLALNFLPRLGFIGSSFIFLPQLGITATL